MKKKIIIFYVNIIILIMLLSSCTPKAVFTPDTLPNAIVGQNYYAEIDIAGGSGPVSAGGFEVSMKPDELWFEVNRKKDNFYNSFIIHGIPKTPEDITIIIKGDMVPTGLFGSGTEFNKTYIIKVKEAE
ncbi:hypothetical protein MTZ49_09710 [Entomomonas sp. E2T0]|uniref:hypothetical protein n=1 Tax=Entomomonas sp. E2T0 TaxID=2930213 RepID=UPI0022283825|nr:hypothetical protein [Entomomonas sp. E2T0]UYZ82888.1 hypothetical protein MTZ49_09710 [Entomomonas sp. E2T0]